VLFHDIEQLIKEAMASNIDTENTQQEVPVTDTLAKLAGTLENVEPGNSRLGVAKLLVAIDILST